MERKYVNNSPFGAKICKDICPRTLSRSTNRIAGNSLFSSEIILIEYNIARNNYVIIKIVRSILLFSEFILLLRLRALVCLTKNEVCINHVYIHEPMFESVIYLRLQGIWYSISKPASSGDCHFSPIFQDVRACNRYNKTRLNSLVIMSLSHFINLTVP